MDTLELYKSVYLIRSAELAIIERYMDDEMKTPVHLSIGQEAIAAGVCHALRPQDQVLCSYRSHGVYLARTMETDGFFAELYGRVDGPCRGKAGSMHLSSRKHGLLGSTAVVGTQIPVAAGVALANKLRGKDAWVAVFFGDGAVDEGVFYETLNFACLHGLKLMFVCEDNGLAIHTPAAQRHGYDDLSRIAAQFRCQVAQSESTAADEIYELVTRQQAVAGDAQRPLLLHLKCYRYLEHVGTSPDFAAGYRSEEDAQAWKLRDPVQVQRALLQRRMPEQEICAVEANIRAQIETSIARAQAAPFPEPRELWSHVRDEAVPGDEDTGMEKVA